MFNKFFLVSALSAAVVGFCGSTAFAQQMQIQQNYVASTGSDSNACTKAAPCRTFAGALAKTNQYGQINVVDSGEYGPFTITTDVSIVANGVTATVTATGSNDILIQMPNGGVVKLIGLAIEGGLINASGGIVEFNATEVEIENCIISGFNIGLEVSVNRLNRTHIYRSKIIQNNTGIDVIAGQNTNGIVIDESTLDYNQTANIVLDGTNGALLVGGSSIQGGPAVVIKSGQPIVQSYGDNRVSSSFPASVVQRQ